MHRRFSGDALRRERERSGLSREAVALAVRRSWKSVLAHEVGEVVPPTGVLQRLAEVLECPLGDLFEEIDHVGR